MARAYPLSQILAIGIAAGAVVLSSAMPVQAQSATNETEITLSDWNSPGVAEVTSLNVHAFPANTPMARTRLAETLNLRAATTAASPAPAAAESATRYPGDLSYHGGKLVEAAQEHPIYLFAKSSGCTTPACWGTPATFLQNLGASTFIHVVDQYTTNTANNRYTLGGAFSSSLGPPSSGSPLTGTQMAILAHQAALKVGAGYGHIFHIFLPPGQDECFSPGVCYSPDLPRTMAYCAYHSSANFTDGTHVVFTVEPYQNVADCTVQPGTPNGQLVDSTMSVLSHELIETITDPDPGTGWYNTSSQTLFDQEIGDECTFVEFIGTRVYFDAPPFLIGTKKYAVQREYNNAKHGCTEAP